jgi:hypothetical protein
LVADSFDHHGARYLRLNNGEDIANLDFPCRLHIVMVDLDMTQMDLLRRQ